MALRRSSGGSSPALLTGAVGVAVVPSVTSRAAAGQHLVKPGVWQTSHCVGICNAQWATPSTIASPATTASSRGSSPASLSTVRIGGATVPGASGAGVCHHGGVGSWPGAMVAKPPPSMGPPAAHVHRGSKHVPTVVAALPRRASTGSATGAATEGTSAMTRTLSVPTCRGPPSPAKTIAVQTAVQAAEGTGGPVQRPGAVPGASASAAGLRLFAEVSVAPMVCTITCSQPRDASASPSRQAACRQHGGQESTRSSMEQSPPAKLTASEAQGSNATPGGAEPSRHAAAYDQEAWRLLFAEESSDPSVSSIVASPPQRPPVWHQQVASQAASERVHALQTQLDQRRPSTASEVSDRWTCALEGQAAVQEQSLQRSCLPAGWLGRFGEHLARCQSSSLMGRIWSAWRSAVRHAAGGKLQECQSRLADGILLSKVWNCWHITCRGRQGVASAGGSQCGIAIQMSCWQAWTKTWRRAKQLRSHGRWVLEARAGSLCAAIVYAWCKWRAHVVRCAVTRRLARAEGRNAVTSDQFFVFYCLSAWRAIHHVEARLCSAEKSTSRARNRSAGLLSRILWSWRGEVLRSVALERWASSPVFAAGPSIQTVGSCWEAWRAGVSSNSRCRARKISEAWAAAEQARADAQAERAAAQTSRSALAAAETTMAALRADAEAAHARAESAEMTARKSSRERAEAEATLTAVRLESGKTLALADQAHAAKDSAQAEKLEALTQTADLRSQVEALREELAAARTQAAEHLSCREVAEAKAADAIAQVQAARAEASSLVESSRAEATRADAARLKAVAKAVDAVALAEAAQVEANTLVEASHADAENAESARKHAVEMAQEAAAHAEEARREAESSAAAEVRWFRGCEVACRTLRSRQEDYRAELMFYQAWSAWRRSVERPVVAVRIARLVAAQRAGQHGRLLSTVVDAWWRTGTVRLRSARDAAEKRHLSRLQAGYRKSLGLPWLQERDARPGGAMVLLCWCRWRWATSSSRQGTDTSSTPTTVCRRRSLLRARQVIQLQRGSLAGEIPQADVDRANEEFLGDLRGYEAAVKFYMSG